MANPSYTLLDDFELKGFWWLPEKPAVKISGILSFKNEKKIVLELLGSLYDKHGFSDEKLFHPKIILGATDNGYLCTLYQNVESKSQLNSSGIHKSIIESKFLLVGKHFQAEEKIKFTSFQVNFTNLESWLVKRPFTLETPSQNDQSEWRLIHKWPEEFQAKLEEINSVIQSTHDFATDGDRIRDVIWKSRAYLKINPENEQHLKWYWEIIYDLCNLLTLLIGETTYILQLKAFGDEIEISPGKTIKEPIELYFSQNKLNLKEDIHPFQMIISFPVVGDMIDQVLAQWFLKAKTLRFTYDLFFGTFYNPSMYLQFHFLSLMQAIESFHRVTRTGKYLNDKEWKPFRDQLANKLPVELDRWHKESLKSRIKYGNEYSLRKRINDLLQSLDENTLSLLSPSANYFTNDIVNTRHYLTHYDDELKDNALEGADLYWANQRLRILITILLLKEIGLEESVIIESMKHNYSINQIFEHK